MKKLVLLLIFHFFVVTITAHSLDSEEIAMTVDTIKLTTFSEGNKIEVLVFKKAGLTTKLPAIVFIVGSGEFST